MRYNHSFYLDLLGFLRNTLPKFYWGEYINRGEFETLQDLVEDISSFITLSKL